MWLLALGPLLASWAVTVVLGPWPGTGLLGCGCTFAPGLVLASQAVSSGPRAGAGLSNCGSVTLSPCIGSSPSGLWLQSRGLVPACLAVAMALGPRADAGLCGCNCGFTAQGWCWPLWLWLQSSGPVPTSQAVAVDLGLKLVLASQAVAVAVASGPSASAGLSG